MNLYAFTFTSGIVCQVVADNLQRAIYKAVRWYQSNNQELAIDDVTERIHSFIVQSRGIVS